MSQIRQLEIARTEYMEPQLQGDGLSYIERQVETHLYRCEGCGLVWEKKWHAQTCENRKHIPSFDQGPYGATGSVNGILQGNLKWYTRRAVRRDKIDQKQEG